MVSVITCHIGSCLSAVKKKICNLKTVCKQTELRVAVHKEQFNTAVEKIEAKNLFLKIAAVTLSPG